MAPALGAALLDPTVPRTAWIDGLRVAAFLLALAALFASVRSMRRGLNRAGFAALAVWSAGAAVNDLVRIGQPFHLVTFPLGVAGSVLSLYAVPWAEREERGGVSRDRLGARRSGSS